MSLTSNAAPGGWQDSYGLRVAKKLVLGTSSITAALVIYGAITGRNASFHDVTAQNLTSTGTVAAATVEGTTVSGATLRTTAANTVINDTRVETNALSGATVTAAALSGKTLYLLGTNGGILCLRSDGKIGYRTLSASGTITAGSCN